MNNRTLGIIGGVALVLAILAPFVLGNANKVKKFFEEAEMLYEREDYEIAITKYTKALQESEKIGAKTEAIDTDFTTLVNLKIAWCYYKLAENTSDVRHNQQALVHIKKVASDTQVAKYQEELTYLWAENLYAIEEHNQAKFKFAQLIEKFPKSQWIPKTLYRVAEINYQQENYDAALAKFQELVERFPHSELTGEAERRISELTGEAERNERNDEDRQRESESPEPDDRAKQLLKKASDLQEQGKIHDAYERYTQITKQYPKSEYVTDAYVGKAEIHLEAKDYATARKYYEEAMYSITDGDRKEKLYRAYHRTYLVPNPDRNRRRPKEPIGELFVKARLLRLERQWLKAAEVYEKLLNRNLSVDDRVYGLYWCGRCYYEAAQMDSTLFSKPVEVFKKITTGYENSRYDINAYYYLTLAYSDWAEELSGDLSKHQSVIHVVEKANAKYVDNHDPTVREWLSRMQELSNRAAQELSPDPEPDDIELEPDDDTDDPEPEPDYERFVNQGHEYLNKGDLEAAVKKVKQALSRNPNYTPADELKLKIKERYYRSGWVLFGEEQYEKAIEEFKKTIALDSEFKEAYCYLGAVYIEQEKYTKAIEVLRKAIDIDEQFEEAYFNLALAYLKRGHFKEAREAAEAALRIDPNYEPPRRLIEFIAD
ncbi:MAG: tetratricopeptide repeat protein [Candidatus Poribacteria bacterium]|nr:tetratricopeptide repeat protein [Candidatus Poribacteria bacterium]